MFTIISKEKRVAYISVFGNTGISKNRDDLDYSDYSPHGRG